MQKEIKEKANQVEFEEVEGYEYCDSHKERCLNDCVWPFSGSAITDLN